MARRPVAVADLDGAQTYRRYDPHDLGRLLREFPVQVGQAAQLAADVDLGPRPPRGVVIAGMGGSAIAGDLVHSLFQNRAAYPIQVVRGYELPAWAGRDSLVVVSSYSGETEETLAVLEEAKKRRARLVAVTSGGSLAERVALLGEACIRVPGGMPPRAALAYLLMPLMALLDRMGDGGADAGGYTEAAAVLGEFQRELLPETTVTGNPAKQLATWLMDRTPAFYAGELLAAVAYRWRTQLEENAKMLALSGVLPEMNHNAIEAWGARPARMWAVVLLRDAGEHPRVARRAELTRAITAARVPTREVWTRGSGVLARTLSLVLLGDWMSYYLAIARGVDPWPVTTLDTLKRLMRDSDASLASP